MTNIKGVNNQSKVPFIYVDFDNSNAKSANLEQEYRVLLLGKGKTEEVDQYKCHPITSEKDAKNKFGNQSQLHLMAKAFFENNTSTKLYGVALEQHINVETKSEDSSKPKTKNKLSEQNEFKPDFKNLFENISNDHFHIIAHPYTDYESRVAISEELEKRFQPKKSQEGLSVSAISSDESEELLDEAKFKRVSSGHSIIMPTGDSKTDVGVWAAALAGVIAFYGNEDAGLPFNTLPVLGVNSPSRNFTMEEREQLLNIGFSTFKISSSDQVKIERLVTTYKNEDISSDTSYLSPNTLLILSYLRFTFRTYFSAKYPRCKLASDQMAARLPSGTLVMTPTLGKAEALSLYKSWEAKGYVDNYDEFKSTLKVEINSSNSSRLDFEMNPKLVNQLNIIGAKVSFTL